MKQYISRSKFQLTWRGQCDLLKKQISNYNDLPTLESVSKRSQIGLNNPNLASKIK